MLTALVSLIPQPSQAINTAPPLQAHRWQALQVYRWQAQAVPPSIPVEVHCWPAMSSSTSPPASLSIDPFL